MHVYVYVCVYVCMYILMKGLTTPQKMNESQESNDKINANKIQMQIKRRWMEEN